MAENKCPNCGGDLAYLGGCSAHPDNWYCEDTKGCGYRAWDPKTHNQPPSMKLWLLRPLPAKDLPDNDNPWKPWYDKVFGYVVRARTEVEAREIADEQSGGEETTKTRRPWKDPKYSTCTELLPEGEGGLIMMDMHDS